MCGPCVTFPSLALWAGTYPYNFMANLGGRYQACTMPFNITPQQAFAVRNIFNPAYRALAFAGAMQNNLQCAYGQNNNVQSAIQLGSYIGASHGIGQNINNMVGDVGKFVDDINRGIGSGKLNEEQKQKMEELKRKAEMIQQRLQDLRTLKDNGANLAQVQEILSQITGDFNALKAEAQALANEIRNAQASSTSGGTSGTENADENSEANEESNEESNEVSEPTEEEKYAAKQICSKIDKAIIGWGTNYDDNEDGLLPMMKKLDGNNVMTVIDIWNDSYAKYGAYADDKKGFIESLMDDCEGQQKEDIADLLIDALEKRARDLNINVDSEVASARMSAHPNWIGWRDDDKICDAVNALIEKVRAGEKAKKAE